RATATAPCWEELIAAVLARAVCSRVRSSGKTASRGSTILEGSNQAPTTSTGVTRYPGPPSTETVVIISSPSVGWVCAPSMTRISGPAIDHVGHRQQGAAQDHQAQHGQRGQRQGGTRELRVVDRPGDERSDTGGAGGAGRRFCHPDIVPHAPPAPGGTGRLGAPTYCWRWP